MKEKNYMKNVIFEKHTILAIKLGGIFFVDQIK